MYAEMRAGRPHDSRRDGSAPKSRRQRSGSGTTALRKWDGGGLAVGLVTNEEMRAGRPHDSRRDGSAPMSRRQLSRRQRSDEQTAALRKADGGAALFEVL
jgi:hypothetical protein